MCLCERERESEKQRVRDRERVSVCLQDIVTCFWLSPSLYLTPHCCTICNEEFLRQKRERQRERERENLCVFTRVSLSVHKYISKSKESACKEP